ncbi:MAG: hypothetical protein IPK70_05145 [Flavobacteriales bacterium]|jgi:hypothetical protein|nr:hypothetical protein [Flavobacteriales bacterium]
MNTTSNFKEWVNLFIDHWGYSLVLFFSTAGIIWTVIKFIYGYRIAAAERRSDQLQKELDTSREKLKTLPGANEPGEGMVSFFTHTKEASEKDLIARIESAQRRITMFGLTRNHFVTDAMAQLIMHKALSIPVVFFIMDPSCASRKDRYRIEPANAALNDPKKYRNEVEAAMLDLMSRAKRTEAGSTQAGLAIYYYNFPCSFAIEEFDDDLRVMLYGHGKRGTQGPILNCGFGHPLSPYFNAQLRWLEKLALGQPYPPWSAKGLVVRRLSPVT